MSEEPQTGKAAVCIARFQDEYRRFLKRYEVEYERYVWY